MSVGLEGRAPLLDHRILEFVATLPSAFKLKEDVPKYLLRKVLHKYVPDAIVDRPKMGFSIPIHEWFRKELAELLTTYLTESRLREGGHFHGREVVRLRDRYLSTDADHASSQVLFEKCWNILVFEMWKERWAA
jgi:asparagine synthase (glutamine-hydrolysing)